MLEQDRDEVIAKLRTHFSSCTDGDAELLWRSVRGQERADVLKALEEHRLDCGRQAYRPDIRAVFAKSMAHRNARRKTAARQERISDWIRQGNPHRYSGVADEAAIIDDHYREAWLRLLEDAEIDDYGRQMARAFILSHSRSALSHAGFSPEAADKSARNIVGLMPGEIISRFRRRGEDGWMMEQQ